MSYLKEKQAQLRLAMNKVLCLDVIDKIFEYYQTKAVQPIIDVDRHIEVPRGRLYSEYECLVLNKQTELAMDFNERRSFMRSLQDELWSIRKGKPSLPNHIQNVKSDTHKLGRLAQNGQRWGISGRPVDPKTFEKWYQRNPIPLHLKMQFGKFEEMDTKDKKKLMILLQKFYLQWS